MAVAYIQVTQKYSKDASATIDKKQFASALGWLELSCYLKSEVGVMQARGRGEKAAWQSRVEPVFAGEAAMS